MTTLNVDTEQDERYRGAAAEYGGALERLARAYEADPDWRRDLLQEIHLALEHLIVEVVEEELAR